MEKILKIFKSLSFVTILLTVGQSFPADASPCDEVSGITKYFLLHGKGVASRTQSQSHVPKPTGEVLCLTDDPDFEKILALSWKTLFSSGAGQKIIREVLQCSEADLTFHFGISNRDAEDILDSANCKTDGGSQLRKSAFLPRIYLHSISPFFEDLDSYTVASENLVILFNGEITPERLIKILAHELAVFLDPKSGNYFWPGLRPDFKVRDAAKDQQIENLEIPSVIDPILQNSFTALRAFSFERDIFSSLDSKFGIDYNSNATEYRLIDHQAKDSKKECMRAISKIVHATKSAHQFYWNFGIFYDKRLSATPGVLKPMTDSALETLVDRNLKTLATLDLDFANFRKSLCEYLATPEISSQWVQTAGGPRPRIRSSGGGD